jgi:4-oxalocrotonate tautomerase
MMPIIQVYIAEGRTVEQKVAAMGAITDVVVRTLDVRPEQVRILITEVNPENYAIAGEPMSRLVARASGTTERGA